MLKFGDGGMALGAGLMHDEEVRTGREVRSNIRGANFLSVYGEAGGVDLVGTIYFQPAMSDWGDHRILVLLEGSVPFGDYLGIGLSVYWRRDARPPPRIEKHDAGIQVAFRVDVG